MSGVETFTTGEVKDELMETARSMRALTDNLDKRTADISVGLTRFSNNGLKEYEALAVDARRTLAELGKAIRNFDRNPQRVIFGPSSSEAQATEPAAAARNATPRPAAAPRAAPRPAQSQRQSGATGSTASTGAATR